MKAHASRIALTTTAILSTTILSSPAWADCLPNAGGDIITCSIADPDGYNGAAINDLTINVIPDADVTGTLSTGMDSAVNNEGNINVAGTAISVGGGSTVSNASTATGIITGDIVFGATSGTQVNTLNNYNANAGGITGDISAAGVFNLNNTGIIVGDLTSTGNTTIVNSGSFTGNMTLGAGNDIITNSGTLTGNVNMGAGTNVFNAASGALMPTGTLTADAAGLNTLNLGAGGGTIGAVTNFDVMNVDSVDGPFWDVTQSLSLSDRINLNSGWLTIADADFLGSNLVVNNAGPVYIGGLWFKNTATGTYSGDMSGTGVVYVGWGGAGSTTFSGNNSYTGGTYIHNGTLSVTGGSALADNGDVYLASGGILDVAATETIGALNNGGDYGGTGAVTLSGGNLRINSGSFAGVISGANGIEKIGTGTLTLNGANTFTGAATVTDGTLILSGGAAIGDTTAVVVNATSTTAGTLQVDTAETIGSLAGNGGSVVLNAGLTTGGNNSSTTYAGAISGTGSLTKTGTGAFTLTGANSYSGGTTVSGGGLRGFAGANASLQGDIAVASGASVTFDQTLVTPRSGTYAGALSGAGTAIFLGDSSTVLTLTGNNSGLATMDFISGTVRVGAANNLAANLIFDGGTLNNSASFTTGSPIAINTGGAKFLTDAGTTLTLSGNIANGTGAGSLTKLGTGTLILTGSNSYTGGTTVSAGILQGSAGDGLQGDILNNAQVNFTGFMQTYEDDMSGTGSVRVIDNALIGFDGTNSYTGSTTIEEGSELVSFGANALSPQSAFIVDGILAMDEVASNTIGSLSGSGLVVTGGGTLNIGANNGSTTFSGVIGSGGYFDGTSANINKIGTGTLTLTGTGSTLTGNLGVDAGVLDLDGSLTAATTTVANNATLYVDGTLTSPTVTVAQGGRLGGGMGTTPGVINGAVTNNGTIAPGHSPGILNIDGSYVQGSTGTYVADVYGNGTSTVVAGTDYDRIAVTGTPGTATLAGNLQVVQNGGLYVNGTAYDIITTTGGITGSLAISGNVISPFITLSNSVAGSGIVGNNYRLLVVRSAYNSVATNPNQIAVANGLQALLADPSAAATMVKIDNMTAPEAQALFDQASPEAYGAYATALQDQGNLFTRQVAGRMYDMLDTGRTGFWVNGYGQWGSGKTKTYRIGSNQEIIGFAAGVDHGMGNVTLGLAGGYSENDVDYLLGNVSGKSKSWQLGGYAAYQSGQLRADAQIAYIHGDIDATKLISAGSGSHLISGTSDISSKGHLFKGIATVGYDFGSNGMQILPYIGVNFTSGKIDGFRENGLGVLNLTVEDIDADRTDLLAGIRLSMTSGQFMPYLNAAYRYAVDGEGDRAVSGFFNDNPATRFTVASLGSGRSQGDVDAGVNYRFGNSASVFVGYEGLYRSDMTSHGVNGGVRFSF